MKWLAAKVTPFAALLGLVFANDLPDLLVRDVSLALGFALLLAIFVPFIFAVSSDYRSAYSTLLIFSCGVASR